MTSLFDGLSGLLNDVFGGPVTWLPRSGREVTIQAIFREEPVTVAGDDGRNVLIVAPTLSVPQDGAVDMARGDRVEVGGRDYRILNRIASASPASDRFVVFQLEVA